MPFEIKPDTPVNPVNDGSGVVIVSGPGGSPWVVDPTQPHLGGNFDGGDAGSMYPNDLWPWLVQRFSVQSMADIGAGTGESARWFAERGIKTLCVEGLDWNAKKCPAPVLVHDLEKQGPCKFDPVDLVWCADTAEHIAEEHVDALIQTVIQGKVLAMCQGTDAHPGGWHHVNNKPEQYWIEKLAAAGMIEDSDSTNESRRIGNHGWWAVSGRIYRKKEAAG